MSHLVLLLFFGADIHNLDADQFVLREQAQAKLTRHAGLTWRLCERKFASAEQRWRAKQVVDTHLHIADLRPLPEVIQKWPCAGRLIVGSQAGEEELVGLWGEGPLLWLADYYAVKAGAPERDPNSLWNYLPVGLQREATRLLVSDLLHAGVPKPLVRRIVCKPGS